MVAADILGMGVPLEEIGRKNNSKRDGVALSKIQWLFVGPW